jgi:hypothetical protein
VKKGKTLTVKGALTRADWETAKYSGYTGRPVALQFKAKGANAYKTVKTVTSGTAGTLTTTVKASADGSYRYKFAGTSTTGAATATGDYVDVKQPRTGPPPTHSKSPPPQTNSSAAGATSRGDADLRPR